MLQNGMASGSRNVVRFTASSAMCGKDCGTNGSCGMTAKGGVEAPMYVGFGKGDYCQATVYRYVGPGLGDFSVPEKSGSWKWQHWCRIGTCILLPLVVAPFLLIKFAYSPTDAETGVQVAKYDCTIPGVKQQKDWPQEQREWCCKVNDRWCEEATSDKYKCREGDRNTDQWSDKQAYWCCRHTGLGCAPLTTTTTTTGFDCLAGYAAWENLWPVKKRLWCCLRHHRGCPTTQQPVTPTTSLRFYCTVGLANWVLSWSHEKKQWCCAHGKVGCLGPSNTTLAIAFDCSAGNSNWVLGWSADKSQWCCKHKSRGCATTTAAVAVNVMASNLTDAHATNANTTNMA